MLNSLSNTYRLLCFFLVLCLWGCCFFCFFLFVPRHLLLVNMITLYITFSSPRLCFTLLSCLCPPPVACSPPGVHTLTAHSSQLMLRDLYNMKLLDVPIVRLCKLTQLCPHREYSHRHVCMHKRHTIRQAVG